MEQVKEIHVRYFAALKEQAGISQESLKTSATTARELYRDLEKSHRFSLSEKHLKVAVNQEYQDLDYCLHSGDSLVFIPPVAGG
ncbi:MAG: molybdopterin converting factor subunit 1 [Chlamydiales bacterium]|jgi:molybdopterin converting factor subunit 1